MANASYGVVDKDQIKADREDYVWLSVQTVDTSSPPDQCFKTDTHLSCYRAHRNQNEQQIIDKFGLSSRVYREQDTLYVELPNRQHPLTFRDERPIYEDGEIRYELYKYDDDQQILYLHKQVWESSDTVAINLKTGQWQVFAASFLTFSPDLSYAMTAEMFPKAESILLWRNNGEGKFELVYSGLDNSLTLEKHLDFYDAYNDNPFDVNIDWINATSAIVDFIYLKTYPSDKGYRVRFFYFLDEQQDAANQWKLVSVR